MTYKQYIRNVCNKFALSEDEAEMILINQKELIPDETAEVDPTVAKRALVAEFATLIPLANITEGGYSVSWNIEMLKLWYQQTCKELGIADDKIGVPEITDKSDIW